MRRLVGSVALALLALLLSGALLLGAVQQGMVAPPEGVLWLGSVALSGHRDCIAQWNMPCAAARPWTLRLIIRHANGGWQFLRLARIEPVPQRGSRRDD